MKSIVSVSGFGFSGTTAVVDFLKSFSKDVEIAPDIEFQILYFPDGISDLDYKLNNCCNRFYDSDVAIRRFLDYCRNFEFYYPDVFHGSLASKAQAYIDSLTSVSWMSTWTFDRLSANKEQLLLVDAENVKRQKWNRAIHLPNRCLRKLSLPEIPEKPHAPYNYEKHKTYLSVKPADFEIKTRNFIHSLVKEMVNTEKEIVLIRQFLPPGAPSKYYKYLPCPAKTIAVTRDPRDLYILAKKRDVLFIPHDEVSSVVTWYRDNHRGDIILEDPFTLRVKFEDIIYNYNEAGQVICKFLGLDPRYINRSFFDPDKSVQNTCLYRNEPDYAADVKVIENLLAEFLYEFPATV